jgi:membrane fusion protein, multidrug efflux system
MHLADRSRAASQCLRALMIPLLFLLPALAGCSPGENRADAKSTPPNPAIPVSVSPVATKPIPLEVSANGSVQSYSTVSITSEVDGRIAEVHFTEGQEVRRGDLLFALDRRPFEAALQQAQATLERDTAQRDQAVAAVAQSEAAAKQAEANLARDMAQLENARAEERRYAGLMNEGAVSREQYDQMQTAARAADATIKADQAAVANAEAAIRAARAAVGTSQGAMAADRAAIENARIQLGYTEIRAPLDGRTGNLLVHAGNTVKAREQGTPLVMINQIHPIYVSFAVPEQSLAQIREYQGGGSLTVQALVPGQETRPEAGKLTFINNTVDPTTGTIQLKATFPNTQSRLWPGQFLNVILTLAVTPNAVVVPSQAIQTGQQGSFVFVVKPDQTVESRPVAVERTLGNETVVRAGVEPGEQVVTQGQIRLVSGAKVQVRPAGPSGPAPSGAAARGAAG